MASIYRGFHRYSLANCLKTGINVTKPLRAIAGLDDVRIHDLRHTYASLTVSQNLSLPIVGKLLGHKITKSTERYAHLYDEVMKSAANF